MSEEGEVVEVPTPAEQVESAEQPQVETPEEKPQQEEPPVPKGVQKRIDRAVRQKYEAEARAKMLEERLSALEQRQFQSQQKPVDNSEPKLENFDNFDAYVAAKAEWIAERKIEQTLTEREKRQMAEREAAEHRKTAEGWTRRMAEATAEMPDFEEVLASSDVPMTPAMQQAIMESDIGPKVAYHLALHPDEAIQIANMSPIRAAAALGRIEERLAARPTKGVSGAPEPIKPVGGTRATAQKDPANMTDAEFAAWRRSQIKARS